jgi:pre-mRNA-splicing factor ATP-dependent RNA helicase DHX16
VGDPRVAEQVNAWLALVKNGLYHKDAHVLKSVRAMYYAAQRYGSKGPGEAIGVRNEKGEETHKGALNMDGTIFVRAAGAMTNALGWVAYGSKEGNWDRSALGWDAAWDNED